MHDLGLLTVTRTYFCPKYVTSFFLLQAAGIMLERAVGRKSARVRGEGKMRVGGWKGRVWTALWLMGSARWMMQGWWHCA